MKSERESYASLRCGDEVYLTKYALSRGITCEKISTRSSDSKFCQLVGLTGVFYIGEEVFISWLSAHEDAEKRRLREIERLERKLEKMRKLHFYVKATSTQA